MYLCCSLRLHPPLILFLALFHLTATTACCNPLDRLRVLWVKVRSGQARGAVCRYSPRRRVRLRSPAQSLQPKTCVAYSPQWGGGCASSEKELASMLVLPARSRLHPLRSAFHASLRSQHKSLGAYGHGLPATHHRHRAVSLQLSMTSEVKSKSG